MNNDDKEAQLTNTHAHAARKAGDENDDCSFDGVDVEDWLIKQHAKKQVSLGQQALKTPLPEGSEGRHTIHETSPQEPTMISMVCIAPTIVELPPLAGPITRTETLDPTVILDAETTAIASCPDFIVAEMSPRDDRALLIEGVKTMGPRRRRILVLLGSLFVCSLIAVAAGMITKQFLSSGSAGDGGVTLDPITTTMAPAPAILSGGGNLTLTIGDAWDSVCCIPGAIESFFYENGNLDVFHRTISRTDKNFTFFAPIEQADVIGGIGPSLIAKVLLSSWNGHVLDFMESILVEGQMAYEDMYDGMVLYSVSGYPLLIQFNPFRVNNNTIVMTEMNVFYKNGVVHSTYQFPKPLVPWLTKSIFEVLLETNQSRNGDLSSFIALIATSPDLTTLVRVGNGLTGITLFVPTNDAMASVDPSIVANSTLFLELARNHFIPGNFVRRSWWTIPTGVYVSETKLKLETQVGQELVLEITDDLVTINETVTILQGDIFSVQGMMHVIDKPLLWAQ